MVGERFGQAAGDRRDKARSADRSDAGERVRAGPQPPVGNGRHRDREGCGTENSAPGEQAVAPGVHQAGWSEKERHPFRECGRGQGDCGRVQRMPPQQKKNGDHTNNRAIFYAVRPFTWREQFPKVSRASRELHEEVINKFKDILPFPRF